jgi:isochorismate synthase EntC
MDARNRVYQMTISPNHTISTSHMLHFALSQGWTKDNPGYFFTVVPEHLFAAAGGYVNGQPLSGSDEQEKNDLKSIMKQYVLTWKKQDTMKPKK